MHGQPQSSGGHGEAAEGQQWVQPVQQRGSSGARGRGGQAVQQLGLAFDQQGCWGKEGRRANVLQREGHSSFIEKEGLTLAMASPFAGAAAAAGSAKVTDLLGASTDSPASCGWEEEASVDCMAATATATAPTAAAAA